jgi:hypothetical protein
MPMENIVYYFIIVALILIVCLCVYDHCAHDEAITYEEEAENFFGGYSYPYDYPYYWPWFYTGCNEDVFGRIRCLPTSSHPYW